MASPAAVAMRLAIARASVGPTPSSRSPTVMRTVPSTSSASTRGRGDLPVATASQSWSTRERGRGGKGMTLPLATAHLPQRILSGRVELKHGLVGAAGVRVTLASEATIGGLDLLHRARAGSVETEHLAPGTR